MNEERIRELKKQLKRNHLEFELINKSRMLGSLDEKMSEKNIILEELAPLTGRTRKELIREASPTQEDLKRGEQE